MFLADDKSSLKYERKATIVKKLKIGKSLFFSFKQQSALQFFAGQANKYCKLNRNWLRIPAG